MSHAVKVVDIRNAQMDLATTRELKQKTELQKKYTSSWVWRSLAAVIEINPEASRSLKWLSQKLNVALEQIVEGLEGLEALGIIERTAQGYKKILKYVYFSDRDIDPKSVLADHVLISSQLLSRLNPRSSNAKSFYRTGFVASNETLVREFCIQVEVLMKEFVEKSSKSVSDRVVGFTFSNVKVTQDDPGV